MLRSGRPHRPGRGGSPISSSSLSSFSVRPLRFSASQPYLSLFSMNLCQWKSSPRLMLGGTMWIQPSLEFLGIDQGKTRTALGHHADCYFLLGLRVGTDKNEVSRGNWD